MAKSKKSRKKKKGAGYYAVPIITVAVFCVVILAVVIAVSNSGSGEETGSDTDTSYSSAEETSVSEVTTSDDTDAGTADTADSASSDTTGNTGADDTSGAETTAGSTDVNSGDDTTAAGDADTTGESQVVIDYPSVDTDAVDITDEDAEKVNAMIAEYMDAKVEAEALNSDPEMTGSYKYEVTSTTTTYESDSFMSVVVTGQYYISDTAHPTIFCYTVNIDLASAKILESDELIYDFSPIKEMFSNGQFTLVYGIDGLLDETNYEDMIIGYYSEYGIYPDVYYTETGFGIVIDLVYALGGYATFEIPVSSVSDYIYVPD
ncbi:MAG: hypothetical protein LUH43_02810 [Clostridia bacterium]|nr:hypothetical protein [Clostridia bacterium]